jgi:hypothetical protein
MGERLIVVVPRGSPSDEPQRGSSNPSPQPPPSPEASPLGPPSLCSGFSRRQADLHLRLLALASRVQPERTKGTMLGSRRRSSRLSSASQASSSNTKQDSPPLSPSSVECSPETKKKTTKRFQLSSVKKSTTKKKTPSQPSLDDPTDVPPAPTNASTSQDKGKGRARQIIQHLPAALSIPPQVSALPSFFPTSTGPESDGDDNNKRLLASFLQSSQPNQPFHLNPPLAYYPNDPALPFGEVMHVENAAEVAPFEQAGGYDNGVPPSMGGAGAGGMMMGAGGGAGPGHQQAHPLLNLYADIARIFYLTNPNEAQILIVSTPSVTPISSLHMPASLQLSSLPFAEHDQYAFLPLPCSALALL